MDLTPNYLARLPIPNTEHNVEYILMNIPSPPTNEPAGLARPNANPTSKPKRPLSAYNLFYRFKRQKIVEAVAATAGATLDKDAIRGVIAVPPGLEGIPESASNFAPLNIVRALRRARILKDLEGNTDPRDTRTRSHRRNRIALNGAMSFVELGKVMNAGWRGCDPFAKSVFDELSLTGRERYRKRVAEYNAHARSQGQCEEEPAEAKATPAPAQANINKPARRRLPIKKYIAAEVKSSPNPSLKGYNASASDDTSAAEAMVQLAAGLIPSKTNVVAPTSDNETESSSAKNQNCAEAPSLPRLSLSGELISNEATDTLSEIKRAAANVKPQDILMPPCAPPSNSAEELLRLHTKRLEEQLANERLRARVQELEAERAREELVWSALDHSMARNQAAAITPPVPSGDSFLLNNGLSGFSGPYPSGMLQQTVSERAAVLTRIADLESLQTLPGVTFKRPSPMMPGSTFPSSLDFDGGLVKKQRLDSLFAARRG